ncbi:MAG: hypothetical protein AAFP02_17805, partial [Bacteroidota bacterium]
MKPFCSWACLWLVFFQIASAQVLPVSGPEGIGLVDTLGRQLLPTQYDDLYTNDQAIHYWLKEGAKTGIYHVDQGLIIAPQYDQIV